jgi:hypothetical protein
LIIIIWDGYESELNFRFICTSDLNWISGSYAPRIWIEYQLALELQFVSVKNYVPCNSDYVVFNKICFNLNKNLFASKQNKVTDLSCVIPSHTMKSFRILVRRDDGHRNSSWCAINIHVILTYSDRTICVVRQAMLFLMWDLIRVWPSYSLSNIVHNDCVGLCVVVDCSICRP